MISADTAADLTSMLEAVVSTDGTGYRASVRNFHIAGKTGTTRKAGVGGYDADRHGAIFAGFAPATDPRLVVVVMIDEPQGDRVSRRRHRRARVRQHRFRRAACARGAARCAAGAGHDRRRPSAGEAMMAAFARRERTLGDLLGKGAGGYRVSRSRT